MADKTIGQLPLISSISDTALLPVEDSGTAYHTTGAGWKQFVQDAIAADVAAVAAAAQSTAVDAASASQDADDAEAARLAIENMGIVSSVLSPGAAPTLQKTEVDGIVTLNFGLAPGATGSQGVPGPAGPQGVQGPRGDTGTAVAVETSGMFYFSVDNDSTSPTFGHLFLTYSGSDAPNMSIVDGHLIWNVS